MGYKNIYVNGKLIGEHRHIWQQANGVIPKGMVIHHINGNKSDNRLSNLRMVTNTQNLQMSDSMGKGYTISKRVKARPYYAQRSVWGVIKHLGNFGTICGAIMATRMAYVTHS